jgi:hypothetical protein
MIHRMRARQVEHRVIIARRGDPAHSMLSFWPGTNGEGQADQLTPTEARSSQESFAACRLGGRAATRNPLKQPSMP